MSYQNYANVMNFAIYLLKRDVGDIVEYMKQDILTDINTYNNSLSNDEKFMATTLNDIKNGILFMEWIDHNMSCDQKSFLLNIFSDETVGRMILMLQMTHTHIAPRYLQVFCMLDLEEQGQLINSFIATLTGGGTLTAGDCLEH